MDAECDEGSEPGAVERSRRSELAGRRETGEGEEKMAKRNTVHPTLCTGFIGCIVEHTLTLCTVIT